MHTVDTATRIADMHPTRGMKVSLDSDGDIHVYIIQDGYPIGEAADVGDVDARIASIEFCVSGGRSRRTMEVLRQLPEAMRLDELERPID